MARRRKSPAARNSHSDDVSMMHCTAADAVKGAEALLAAENAVRANWSAIIKPKIAERASAMLAAYHQISVHMEVDGKLTNAQLEIIREEQRFGLELVHLMEADPEPQINWDLLVDSLSDTLTAIPKMLGLAHD